MHDKFLKIDLDALCRETASQIEGAGWDLDPAAVPNEAGMPGGPTIYLCHYEAQLPSWCGSLPVGSSRYKGI